MVGSKYEASNVRDEREVGAELRHVAGKGKEQRNEG
jgi:hypothetical protein